jgi:hypothetical protein
MDAISIKSQSDTEAIGCSTDATDIVLSINVVSLDYTMVSVEKDDHFIVAYDTTVPVVRIFGSTPSGQRACVHIHGVGFDESIYNNED